MFVSRKYDYGIRIVRALSAGELLTVEQICDIEHIPQSFAYQIMRNLQKASIVQGVRGSKGGYQLVVSLSSVSLYDIYVAIEGTVYINECLQEGADCPNNPKGNRCKVHKLLGKMQDQIISALKQANMAEVLKDDMDNAE